MKRMMVFLILSGITFLGKAQIPNGTGTIAKVRTGSSIGQEADRPVNHKQEANDPNKKDAETDPNIAEDNAPEQIDEQDTDSLAPFKAYSKFDFVPGEKIIAFEDYSTGSIGDFPAGWNTTGAGEIVTVAGKAGRWLWLTKPGVFIPEFISKYPEDFTFEFDLLRGVPFAGADFHFVIAELEKVDQPQHWTMATNRVKAGFYSAATNQKEGTFSNEIRKNSENQSANQFYSELLSDKNNPVHISVWRQKERLRIYCNQEKIWDIPRAFPPEAKLNALIFSVIYAEATVQHFIGNLRLAVGAADTRNKLLTQNKWVTHGILFNVNSAQIKPESYGTLKAMANVLKENADLKVRIVGHTDSDGSDDANLDLSKRRAASVKIALAKEFGIEESRMETSGKGESEPIDKNDHPAGKANNRRVEFIKI